MVKRGDIFWVNFKLGGRHLICGKRPAIIVSNDTANTFSSIVNVIPLTSQNKKILPTHVVICGYGLTRPSIALAEQVVSIDKSNLLGKIGTLVTTSKMIEIDHCLRIQLDVA